MGAHPRLSAKEIEARVRFRDDFEVYSKAALKIRAKTGAIVPFVPNQSQMQVHEALQRQIQDIGKVRALILKARQQGISTYLQGRAYWRTTHRRGYRAFILTHLAEATDNLFEMTSRFHEHCPLALKPATGASNAKELIFSALDSGYSVATAGSKGAGRGKTVQFFHGSEAAFWTNAADHMAGVMQAIPDAPGTESVLESTANGLGGKFHEMWCEAENGVGEYIPIFLPWFLSNEYQQDAGLDFVLTDEENEIADIHGVSNDQLAWRRKKMIEMGDPLLFQQEYPATADEAFVSTGHDSYIKPASVLAARRNERAKVGPLVIGVDPARFENDAFAVIRRRGRAAFDLDRRYNMPVPEAAAWLHRIIVDENPDRMFIDAGGLGIGVIDTLLSYGHEDVVVGVNFGGSPVTDVPHNEKGEPLPHYADRRAEMFGFTKKWLEDPLGADVPDDNGLQRDLCAPGYAYVQRQNLRLESKSDMKRRGVSSPDSADALALTFAEPVSDAASKKPWVPPTVNRASRSASRY